MQELLKVRNVHDAVHRAAILEKLSTTEMKPAGYRVDPERQSEASKILFSRSTTLSAYLRACIDCLIIDVSGPERARELGIFLEANPFD